MPAKDKPSASKKTAANASYADVAKGFIKHEPGHSENYQAPVEHLAESYVSNLSQTLTTNHGVAITDNQNSLRAGERGPSLLEDFHLLEKIAHFDRERIPERVVHARAVGARLDSRLL